MAIPYSRTLPGGLPWYSVLIVFGIVLGCWLAGREEKRLGLPADTMVDLALVVVPSGIIGARLYYVLMSWEVFEADPIRALYIWEGGLAIYGAVIGGGLGIALYAWRKKFSFVALADMVSPSLMLAQAIGRWGNYFNMEAYGPVITDSRLQFFPLAVLIPHAEGAAWHAATFFYESVWNAAGFAFLWSIRKKQRERGNVMAWYFLIYGAGRFLIEQLREDSLYIGSLRASQCLSFLLCVSAALMLIWRCCGRNKKSFAVLAAVCAMWIVRWTVLDNQPVYAGLMMLAGLAALWMKRNHPRAIAWLTAAFVMDGLGTLTAVMEGPVTAAVGFGIHAMLCSVTLIMGVYALCVHEE